MKPSLPLAALAALSLTYCSADHGGDVQPVAAIRPANATATGTLIGPLAEKKFYKLFDGYDSGDNFEGSGVYTNGGRYFVVFDNRYKLGSIASSLPENSSQNTLTGSGSGSSNFEALAYDGNNTPHYYVAEETVAHDGAYYPRIRQYDTSLGYQNSLWTDVAFSSGNSNKGFEGVAYVRRDADDYLLGLIESTGQIKVLKKTSGAWVTQATIPAPVAFPDYSDFAIRGNQVAITTQEGSQLWVGTLSSTSWNFTDAGQVYDFPRGSSNGTVGAGSNVLYGNIEGVSWLDATTLVCVSDKADNSQPSYQQYKDQSIHLFQLP
ncbi:SdiA-regulated/phytase-like domain-containing protein [Hymenobacter terrenus]|uniref:hypothetical protein n=1 Tax=Hymenobacter terrenus TaxID=1629124 RepID=UPI000619B98D|nr:hypothetical protein [Hymenobacter terrenus]